MASEWYCQLENQEYGPLSVEQLRRMAESGRLKRGDFVRKGTSGDWVGAIRVRGLFETDAASPAPAAPPPSGTLATVTDGRLSRISSIDECLSEDERKKRFGVTMVNGFLWMMLIIFGILTLGVLLVGYAVVGIANWLFAEYNVRKLLAFGTTATEEQFPQVHQALQAVCDQFGIKEIPMVIILNDSAINAFAVKFAQKKVIVLLSQTLEGIIDKPAQLRFILAHELTHIVLDHGKRGVFEIYKPAPYRQARELTCDNCGCAAAGDIDSAKVMLRRLGVGNRLFPQLNEAYLINESKYLYSGITGWLLKQYLTHPPLGKRIANVSEFASAV